MITASNRSLCSLRRLPESLQSIQLGLLRATATRSRTQQAIMGLSRGSLRDIALVLVA